MKIVQTWISNEGVKRMDREELAELLDARDKLCAFCENNNCEKCQVTMLIDDAYNECPEADE